MAFAEDTLDKEKNYQWPASKLTGREMAVLYRVREKTGIPISQLLKAAVAQFEALCTEEFLQTLQNGKAKKTAARRVTKRTDGDYKTYQYTPKPKPAPPEDQAPIHVPYKNDGSPGISQP